MKFLNRRFGWSRIRQAVDQPDPSPPLNGLVQWLIDGVDQIGLVSDPIIGAGTITQTDPDMAFSPLWSSDGLNLDTVTDATLIARVSGNDFVWIRTLGGVVREVLTYNHILTFPEYVQLRSYLLSSSNEIIVPVYDIGGNLVYSTEIWKDINIWYDLRMWQENELVYAQPN